jgi:hypothetical protein
MNYLRIKNIDVNLKLRAYINNIYIYNTMKYKVNKIPILEKYLGSVISNKKNSIFP